MTSTARLDLRRPAAPRLRRVPSPPPAFRTPVRGHAFAARPPDAAPLAPGADARLVREPDNPRDPHAVAVWVTGPRPWRLGYLDRAVAARLAPRLDAGQRFAVAVDGWVDAPGGWRRPLLQVAPAPPAPSDPRRDAPGRGSGTQRDGTDVARRDELPAGVGLWGRPPASTRRVVGPAR